MLRLRYRQMQPGCERVWAQIHGLRRGSYLGVFSRSVMLFSCGAAWVAPKIDAAVDGGESAGAHQSGHGVCLVMSVFKQEPPSIDQLGLGVRHDVPDVVQPIRA